MVGLSAVFFALANWGTSDITRFSYYLAIDPHDVLDEPLWIAAAPLISALPYRLASVHGLVPGGFALMPLLLSRVLQRTKWVGLWALLLLWSPLLRNFLQNGVTRQALATVLITPLLYLGGLRAAVPERTAALLQCRGRQGERCGQCLGSFHSIHRRAITPGQRLLLQLTHESAVILLRPGASTTLGIDQLKQPREVIHETAGMPGRLPEQGPRPVTAHPKQHIPGESLNVHLHQQIPGGITQRRKPG